MRMIKELAFHKLCMFIAAVLLSNVFMVFADSLSINSDENAGHEEIDQNRLETITRLLSVIENSDSSQQAKIQAVNTLGNMRAEEAVPVLVSNLALGAGTVVLKGPDPFKKAFPVKDALEKIGKPAVPFILKKIQTTEDSQELWKLTFTLSSITGNKEAYERLQVLTESDRISNVTRKILQELIDPESGKRDLETEKKQKMVRDSGVDIPTEKVAAQQNTSSSNDKPDAVLKAEDTEPDARQKPANAGNRDTASINKSWNSLLLPGLALLIAITAATFFLIRRRT